MLFTYSLDQRNSDTKKRNMQTATEAYQTLKAISDYQARTAGWNPLSYDRVEWTAA